ncbi:MAG: type II secretion system F family protein, partial [Bacillota bacterium]|nr:type II secretion system F family protein [Bacillota bacterium]
MAEGGAGRLIREKFLRRLYFVRFRRQLPDLLHFLAGAVKAGLSLPQALEFAGREFPPPASREARQLALQLQAGWTVEAAMAHLRKRWPGEEVDLLAAAVTVQSKTGGNLARLLVNIAEAIRERQRIEGLLRTLTAQGRLTAAVVSLLPLGLGLAEWYLAPQFIQPLWASFQGRCLLGVGALLFLSGVGWMWKKCSASSPVMLISS